MGIARVVKRDLHENYYLVIPKRQPTGDICSPGMSLLTLNLNGYSYFPEAKVHEDGPGPV